MTALGSVRPGAVSMVGRQALARVVGTYRAAFSGLPREVWVLAAATLVNRSGSMVLPFLTLYLTHRLGFSLAEAGSTLSLYGAGAVAGAAVGGWLADRLGAVRLQVLSLLATGVGFVVLGSLRGRLGVWLAVAALSVVAEAFRPASFSAVAAASPPEVRTRALALLRLAVNLGMSIGPAVGGVLAVRHYGLLFIVDAATCWLAAGVLAVALRRGRGHPRGEEQPAQAARPWRDGPFLQLLVLVFLLATVFYQVLATLPLYLRAHFALAEDRIGLVFSVNTVLIVLFEMVLLRCVERVEPFRVAALGSFLVGAGFALMPLFSVPLWAPATVVVWTLGEMLSLPITNALAASRVSGEGRGRYLGAYLLAFSLAFVAGPAMGTAVYERYGASALWLGAGGVGVGLAAGFLRMAAGHGGRWTLPSGGPGGRTYALGWALR